MIYGEKDLVYDNDRIFNMTHVIYSMNLVMTHIMLIS